MNRLRSLILLLVSAALLPAQQPVDTLTVLPTAPLEVFEKAFTPSLYDTEFYLYGKDDTGKVMGRAVHRMSAAPPETLQGYRIQLLATNGFDEANETRNLLTAEFPELWIYLVFEAPTYKIRVGDFVNRAEAKSLLDQFQAKGYRKAWIVPDRIIRNQPPKPPVPVPFDLSSFPR